MVNHRISDFVQMLSLVTWVLRLCWIVAILVVAFHFAVRYW